MLFSDKPRITQITGVYTCIYIYTCNIYIYTYTSHFMRCVSVYTHIYIYTLYIYITCTYIAGADVLSVRQDIPLVAVVPWRYLPGGSSARPARRLCLDIWSSPKTTNLFRWNELLQDSIYLCVSLYMILVPGPVAPPQCYGPLLPDLESFISIVLTAFWMQNLVFPWYLHRFGWRTSYFHGMYSIWMQNLLI